jgi:hypothetical protein
VAEAIGVLGQAVLVLTALVLAAFLLWLFLVVVRAIRRLIRELREPLLPYSDSVVPPPFDRR